MIYRIVDLISISIRHFEEAEASQSVLRFLEMLSILLRFAEHPSKFLKHQRTCRPKTCCLALSI